MNAAERKAKLKEVTDHPETACRTGIPITYHGSIITLNAYGYLWNIWSTIHTTEELAVL